MSSRSRKTFPPGTFIPTSQRLMAIGQLCLAFSLMLWYMTQPFMGEYFALRSRMLLYEYAMGTSDILKARNDHEAKLERQAQRFKHLPEIEHKVLKSDYQHLQNYAQRLTLQKIGDGLRVFIQKIPPFEQAWIFFSVIIALLILLKVEGAKQAAWLLPLIVFLYILDNQLTGKTPAVPPDYSLFPTEETLIKHYMTPPLAQTPFAQKQQLEEGWHRYLIDKWLPSSGQEEKFPLETAEFHFTLARLHALHGQPRSEWLPHFHEKLGAFTLLSYLLWNGLFAWVVSRPKKQPFPQPSS